MKKTLFPYVFAVFALLAVFSTRANAQITGITVADIDSTLSNGCEIPFLQTLNIWGTVQGVIPPMDSVTIDVNFGDGVDSIFKTSDQNGNEYAAYINHDYQIAGTFAASVTATTSNGFTANSTSQTFIVTNNCASINGQIYVDLNSNCTYDVGTDAGLHGVPLVVTNTTTDDSVYAWADTGGHYAVNMPNGYSYTIKPLLGMNSYYVTNLNASCPVNGIATVALTGASQEADFGYVCAASSNVDMYASGWAESYRPGYNRQIGVYGGSGWYYYLCNSVSGTLTLTLDSRLTYTGTLDGSTPTSVSGNTLTWNYTATTNITDIFSEINVLCDASANIGDTICNTVTITSSGTDPNMANNSYTFCAPVSNSYDPNSKEVSPQGTGATGLIPNNTPLSYLINFQNTGTDVAYNVTITDTLNANLDINSVKLNRSSAAVQVYTLPGNVLNFRFNNINLPDSTANSAGSHGFVSYTVMPKANLAVATQITNAAHIYFDFNKAINTNTTVNTIEGPTGIQQLVNGTTKVSVYPNPANEQVTIKADNGAAFTVSVLDMLGRVVNNSNSENGNMTIGTQSLSSGLYLVKITTSNGTELTTKLNVQH